MRISPFRFRFRQCRRSRRVIPRVFRSKPTRVSAAAPSLSLVFKFQAKADGGKRDVAVELRLTESVGHRPKLSGRGYFNPPSKNAFSQSNSPLYSPGPEARNLVTLPGKLSICPTPELIITYFISLVFLKITIAPENKAVTLPPETGKKSLSPARSPRPGRLPRKGRVSPVRRLKRASSMVRGMVQEKEGEVKIVGQPRIPPRPHRKVGSKNQGHCPSAHRTSKAFVRLSQWRHLPSRPSSRRRRQSHSTVPYPVQTQKAVPTDCRHGIPEKPPLREH